MKTLYVDTETTGLNPEIHGMIQVAGIIVNQGREMERFDFKVRAFPNQKIEESALKVNKTTIEQINAYPKPEEVYPKLLSILTKYGDEKYFFAAFNAPFDVNFLMKFFENCDPVRGKKTFLDLFYLPPLDVMGLAAFVLAPERKTMANFKLATVANRFNIRFDEKKLHEAMNDIEVTRDLMKKIYKILEL